MTTSEAERTLHAAIAANEPVTVALNELRPSRLLEILAGDGASYRVSVQSMSARITVEVGNGLVVGAEAMRDGRTLAGPDAYTLLRGVHSGSARVEPLRFPSLANILEPITQLPDLVGSSSIPPAPANLDTIELTLPEARSSLELGPMPVLTAEIVIPKTWTAPRRAPSVPPPAPKSAPKSSPQNAPQSASRTAPKTMAETVLVVPPARRRVFAAGAAVLLALVGLGAGVYAAVAPTPVAQVAAAEVAVVDAPAPAPMAETDDEADETSRADSRGSRARARTLARQARRLLSRGHRTAALERAREAAELRGQLPFYQVLLGDALAANGQRAAARRAFRRALRLRPGYAPARRRLARSSAVASHGQSATRS